MEGFNIFLLLYEIVTGVPQKQKQKKVVPVQFSFGYMYTQCRIIFHDENFFVKAVNET